MAEQPMRPTLQTTNLPQGTLLNSLQGEVGAEASPLLQFVLNNVRVIATAIAVLILAVLIMAGWRWYTANTVKTAQNELGMILVTKQGADKVASLEAFVATAPAGVVDAAYLELAAAAMNNGDYEKAATAYGKLAHLSGIGSVALVAQSSALLESGKPAEGLSLLEAAEPTINESLRAFVQSHMLVLAQAAGDYKKAITLCEAMLAKSKLGQRGLLDDEFLRFTLQNLQARIAEKA